ncbi:hypothetical protein BO79DRAFT_201075 [Aspergillus costaricaensis CBS 115574]|uniref:Uncharacterized protein n=1 Tax=Aspergillus costaricaensis CBS 115574 TaxID=1448317 RepID=A0ACD1I480_9EURO|nr:hypothetical protein BO79DRAFT_201075 [Aspergillus costaricaensis CBS 115574]RAK85349.1 hypothetical protein BO79DRAFT_201075 [Aspergillus costaricaensis CBS 115574]
MKSSNKPRLYISLHARGGGIRPKMPDKEDTYHWSLTILPKHKHLSPKTKPMVVGTTYHVRDLPTPIPSTTGTSTDMIFKWTYDERSTTLDTMVLVRIFIGKVVDRERLVEILRGVPVPGGGGEGVEVEGEEGWNCVSWVRGAIERIRDDENEVLGKGSVLEWRVVRDAAMGFAGRKMGEGWFRSDGPGGNGDGDGGRVAVWDLVGGREVA